MRPAGGPHSGRRWQLVSTPCAGVSQAPRTCSLDEHIKRIVEAAKPLSPEQLDRLAVLLRGVDVP